jgi:hypothetical protein
MSQQVWFNNKGWPMSVSYLNAITNVVLRASLPPEEDPKQYGIRAINHPMNFTPTQLSQEMMLVLSQKLDLRNLISYVTLQQAVEHQSAARNCCDFRHEFCACFLCCHTD